MSHIIWLVLTALVLGSPALLWFARSSVFDKQSFAFVVAGVSIAAVLPLLGFGDPAIVWQLLFAQAFMFVAFVSVSRMRQRKSAFLHFLTSIFSNGNWFLMMYVFAAAYQHVNGALHGTAPARELVGFLVAMTVGVLGGRLVGVQWMQWVEKRYAVHIDSVGSPTLALLDRYTVPMLLVLFVATPLVWLAYALAPIRDVLIVMGLGFLQNAVHAINTRLANRNHPGWPVVTKLVSSVLFIINSIYLLRYSAAGTSMPLALLVPYVVANVAGSNVGVLASLIFEKLLQIGSPDTHVTHGENYADVSWHRTLLGIITVLCGIYLIWNESLLQAAGITAHTVILPFISLDGVSHARPLSLLFGGAFFFVDQLLFRVTSRAGNRSNASYHAVVCVLHGCVTFFIGSFIILNARFLDLVPLVMLGAASGQLFGQKFSMFMEKRLVSLMDA